MALQVFVVLQRTKEGETMLEGVFSSQEAATIAMDHYLKDARCRGSAFISSPRFVDGMHEVQKLVGK